MAIPTQPTPPKGPAVLARETLIEMAKTNVPPTPANYKRYYENIAGSRTADETESSMLKKMLERLKLQGSPLVAEWEDAVDTAFAKKDVRVLEGLILRAISGAKAPKAPEDSGPSMIGLLHERLKLQDSPLVAEWEKAVSVAFTQNDVRPMEGLILKSVAGAKSLDNSYATVFSRLQDRLKVQTSPMVAGWENALEMVLNQRDPRGLEELILKSLTVAPPPEDGGSAVLQKLLGRLKQQGSPVVSEWESAIVTALAQKDESAIEEMILKSLRAATAETVKDETPPPPPVDKCKTCAEVRAFNGVLYVMESFTKNLAGLFAENPVLMGQIEVVRDVLEHPRETEKLYGAKRALAKMAAADKIQAQLGEAKNSAKNLAEIFLSQIGQTGDDAGEFLREVEAGKKALEEAKDHASMLAASKALLSGTSAVHDKMKENRAKLESAKQETQSAEEKIHALEEKVKTAGEKAQQDYESGLLNQRDMDEQITKMFAEGWERITLALLDIDNFKRINEQLGEEAGEKAVQQLSDAIRESVGTKGISARMPGEEFVIAFAGYDGPQVREEMEKMQRLLTRQIFMANEENRVVTFSAGVAQRAGEEDPSETLSRADDAMYAAKQKGKNRVEVALLY